ncbi:ATP-binding cassette subfamily B protein [Natronocella acetinitrilica]|uniref:ATP-binding cassette subfamily B protein n=1 Tax=Natronocella acetinitrilica TaxID=414046 RepID=A0AAE3G808_9GAMM|nr:ABC transporter ATP-binding protein/permease [Natronocella acetinitrilica]MCP1676123.1 ATP-binding cassette subfamily B protein [Natronocella acetinitrilica]
MRAQTTGDDEPQRRPDWRILRSLLPYLMEYRGRVFLALACLTLAKLANVTVPIALKYIVDHFEGRAEALIAVPLGLVAAYGLLRFSAVFFSELRDAVFARVAERAMRRVSLAVFEHLHRLELAFHLSRRMGGLARDIERGTTGISFLLRFTLFNILPTLLEIAMVAVILVVAFSPGFVTTVLAAVGVYIFFSIVVTEWRTRFVRESNEMDSQSNTRAMDSLLNYETVKYFGNERFEAERYDHNLAAWEAARMKNRLSLAALNSGQALIIAAAVTVMMMMAASQVADGRMSLGDLVMVNAYMIQLFIPLNFLGFVYREIRQALVSIERMFRLLETNEAVVDAPDAVPLQPDGGELRFDSVAFGYQPERTILRDLNFTVHPGQTVAIVGPSGAGKSTIARLLFRFYDVNEGRILINGQDIRDVTQESLRRAIGVVPQDTVLFNESIYYNIAYGRPDAPREAVLDAARRANLQGFIDRLPDGYDTRVGERGLKVSGGEKQRIAIARMLLKDPPILILDEATSALDSHSEQAVLAALAAATVRRTTLAIAHRLSTIMNADAILVLDQGRVVEQGTHVQLLAAGGLYHALWQQQQHSLDRDASEQGRAD